MEELEQGLEVLREGVDHLKSKMDQILEILQVLARREDHPQLVVPAETITPHFQQTSSPILYYQYPYVAVVTPTQYPRLMFPRPPPQQPLSVSPRNQWNHNHHQNQCRPLNNQERRYICFDPIPLTYTNYCHTWSKMP